MITPRVTVVAASTPDDKEHEWAAENLEGVKTYHNYEEMLEKEDLQAVVIASITAVHVEQALKAIEKGLHVLCEKPLSIDVAVVRIPKSIPAMGTCFHTNQRPVRIGAILGRGL